MKLDLTKQPEYLRTNVARGIQSGDAAAIDRDGGDFGAGIIRGASVIARGEAAGHDLWVDGTMLAQVAASINGTSGGVKARFAHPELSGDGIGRALGRYKSAALDGDAARADLHFYESAHDTPDGDLAAYVMDLAAEDPAAFGNSIAFEHDKNAEGQFREQYSETGDFASPDPGNDKNFLHARLGRLRAIDAVDEPAANPNGLFHRGADVVREAAAVLAYSLGLSDTKPELITLGIDGDRAAAFVRRFLAEHDLHVVHTGDEPMSKENDAPNIDEDILRAEGAKSEALRFEALNEKYEDKAFVAEQFSLGHDAEDAEKAWAKREASRLTEENETLRTEVAELKAAGKPGGEPGADLATFNGSGEAGDGDEDFLAKAKRLAKGSGELLHEVMSKLSRDEPDLHDEFVEAAHGTGSRVGPSDRVARS